VFRKFIVAGARSSRREGFHPRALSATKPTSWQVFFKWRRAYWCVREHSQRL